MRDPRLLAAAAGRPQVTVFGDEAYPALEDQPTCCTRWSGATPWWTGTSVWRGPPPESSVLLNGRDLACTVDEAETLVGAAAAGGPDVPDITTWLRHHLEGAP